MSQRHWWGNKKYNAVTIGKNKKNSMELNSILLLVLKGLLNAFPQQLCCFVPRVGVLAHYSIALSLFNLYNGLGYFRNLRWIHEERRSVWNLLHNCSFRSNNWNTTRFRFNQWDSDSWKISSCLIVLLVWECFGRSGTSRFLRGFEYYPKTESHFDSRFQE